MEIEDPQAIIDRLTGDLDHHRNDDFVEVRLQAAE